MIDVTQADRDVAADWCASQPFPSKQAEAPMIVAGEWGHHSLTQAFARHRIAAEQRGMIAARDAAVKEVNSQSDLVCDDCCRDALDIAADAIATMPKGGEW